MARNKRSILFSVFLTLTVGGWHYAMASGSDHSSPLFNNVVIFGDSQSDMGNGPESMSAWTANDDQTLAFNLYVPISNPVDLNENLILPSLQGDLTQPHSYQAYMSLPTQPVLYRSGRDPVQRQFRSLNWVSYFMQNAVKRNLLPRTVTLTPWVSQYQQWQLSPSVQPAPYSLSYAWYSALTTDVCADVSQKNEQPFCGEEDKAPMIDQESTIFEKQKEYRIQQTGDFSSDKALLYHQLVPGAQKQVMMYKQDQETYQIKNDPATTLYIVWIGANDLHQALGDHLIKHLLFTIPNAISGYHQKTPSVVDRLVDLGAKHIVVVGQYNLGYTPQMVIKKGNVDQKHKVANQFDKLTVQYNQALKTRVERYQKRYSTRHPLRGMDIRFVDIQPSVNEYVKEKRSQFYPTIGLRCDKDGGYVEQLLEGGAASCGEQSMGWWNSLHLATQLNQVVAYALLEQIDPSSTHHS